MNNKRIITIKDVTEHNKKAFLQQEARNVARILQIPAFEVELSPDVAPVDIIPQNDTLTVRFSSDVNVFDAFYFLPNLGRQIWRKRKGLLNDVVDCAVFASEYLMYVHHYTGDMAVALPGEDALSQYINACIQKSRTVVAMFGTGYEERCEWISRVRQGCDNYAE